jgi:hypothetical protein
MLKPWALPLVVVALLVPLGMGLVAFGPQGMVFAAVIVALALVIIVSLPRRGRRIEVAQSDDARHHVLVVTVAPIREPRLAERIAHHVERSRDGDGGAERDPDVLVLVPALNTALAHWAADVRGARATAARRLEVSLDRLRWAGLEARGAVGDSNPVLAIEDALREFPVDEVLVVAAEGEGGDLAAELRERLDQPVGKLAPGGRLSVVG